MAPLEAVTQERREETTVDTRSGALVAILFAVLLAALGEVLASRAVMTADAPRVSTWERVLRIGDDARARGDAPTARRAYLSALFRARGEHSLAGVLGVAERFTALGDREIVGHAVSMAASLGVADGDGDAQRRLQELRDELRGFDAAPLAVRVPR